MSANTSFLGVPDDPREVELVHGLAAKTREGKIQWTREGSAITAKVPNGLQLNFVLTTNIFTSVSDWQLFTVRDKSSSELVRVAGPATFALLIGGTNSLVLATDQLFKLVIGAVRDDLDNAIDSVKNL
jgi:hypothetical protein